MADKPEDDEEEETPATPEAAPSPIPEETEAEKQKRLEALAAAQLAKSNPVAPPPATPEWTPFSNNPLFQPVDTDAIGSAISGAAGGVKDAIVGAGKSVADYFSKPRYLFPADQKPAATTPANTVFTNTPENNSPEFDAGNAAPPPVTAAPAAPSIAATQKSLEDRARAILNPIGASSNFQSNLPAPGAAAAGSNLPNYLGPTAASNMVGAPALAPALAVTLADAAKPNLLDTSAPSGLVPAANPLSSAVAPADPDAIISRTLPDGRTVQGNKSTLDRIQQSMLADDSWDQAKRQRAMDSAAASGRMVAALGQQGSVDRFNNFKAGLAREAETTRLANADRNAQSRASAMANLNEQNVRRALSRGQALPPASVTSANLTAALARQDLGDTDNVDAQTSLFRNRINPVTGQPRRRAFR